MNESAMVEAVRHWTLAYNILLCCNVAMLVLMAWRLHKAEKAIKELQAGICSNTTYPVCMDGVEVPEGCSPENPEAACPICKAKPGEKCDAGLHG